MTGRTGARNEHRIGWRLVRGWGAAATVTCEADPVKGRCYHYCPIAECEDGCVAPDEHEQTINPTCNVKDWLESSDVGDFYMGGETPVRDGYIRVWWDDNGVCWEYADDPSSSSAALTGGEQ